MLLTLLLLLLLVCAYVVLGGADYGRGVLEMSLRDREDLQQRLQTSMAPVWEANHVWLIAIVVTLFMGLPRYWTAVTTWFFVPVSLALLGVVLRGAFFTFRRYDPDPGPRLPLYNALFRISSVMVPVLFGMLAVGVLRPLPPLDTTPPPAFHDAFLRPWLSWTGLAAGATATALFGYVAAVFFLAQVPWEADRQVVRGRVLAFLGATVLLGGVTLILGAIEGIVPVARAWDPLQLLAQGAALIGIFLLGHALRHHRPRLLRATATLHVLAILLGWFGAQMPGLLRFTDGRTWTVSEVAAPPQVLVWLNGGLLVGLALMLPLLVYLFRVFDPARDAPPAQASGD